MIESWVIDGGITVPVLSEMVLQNRAWSGFTRGWRVCLLVGVVEAV
ncbi:hypothetical protein ACWGF2_40070 [Streptomyces sp. NPDC054919]